MKFHGASLILLSVAWQTEAALRGGLTFVVPDANTRLFSAINWKDVLWRLDGMEYSTAHEIHLEFEDTFAITGLSMHNLDSPQCTQNLLANKVFGPGENYYVNFYAEQDCFRPGDRVAFAAKVQVYNPVNHYNDESFPLLLPYVVKIKEYPQTPAENPVVSQAYALAKGNIDAFNDKWNAGFAWQIEASSVDLLKNPVCSFKNAVVESTEPISAFQTHQVDRGHVGYQMLFKPYPSDDCQTTSPLQFNLYGRTSRQWALPDNCYGELLVQPIARMVATNPWNFYCEEAFAHSFEVRPDSNAVLNTYDEKGKFRIQ